MIKIMIELGICVYPEKSKLEDIKNYLLLCKKYNVEYLYLNSLCVNLSLKKEDFLDVFQPVCDFAHELGYKIVIDTAPRFFDLFNIDYKDLSFFRNLHAYGLRIDQPFSGSEEAIMSYDQGEMHIDLQLSNCTHWIDTVMDYYPKKGCIAGCHNFYPSVNSALTWDYYHKCNEFAQRYNLPVYAYISSQAKDTFCMWENTTKGQTIEAHRNLSMNVQIKDFINHGSLERLIIGNSYASEEELQAIQSTLTGIQCLNISLDEECSDLEKQVLFNELHFVRGDMSPYKLRSTQPRVKYKGNHFKLINPKPVLEKGDVVIVSHLGGMYSGEVQIITKEFENDGTCSVVGRVVDEELFLLDSFKPWQKFKFENLK